MAAGRGLRAGGAEPKQYANLGGAPLICRTIENFLRFAETHKTANNEPAFSQIALVINPADEALCRQALGVPADKIQLVHGGATRQTSTLNGLRFLSRGKTPPAFVHIHDGARPFVSPALLAALQTALTAQNGVLPVLPVAETLKRADAQDFITETVPRAGLYAAQTPQSFPFAAILRAHETAAAENRGDFTDDSALAEAYGLPVKKIRGTGENIKITWAEDMKMAEMILAQANSAAAKTADTGGGANALESAPENNLPFPDIRTGNGYDVHQLSAGDGIMLCGIKIPCALALHGHSDADVALHALTDALLATCGAGDIGTHFPPSDPQWKGAASEIFIRHAAALVKQKGGQIINADITLICEAPKIAPHREAMAAKLQELLSLAPERVSVKATTNETLGFIGRGEGIAAIATANVFYR